MIIPVINNGSCVPWILNNADGVINKKTKSVNDAKLDALNEKHITKKSMQSENQ